MWFHPSWALSTFPMTFCPSLTTMMMARSQGFIHITPPTKWPKESTVTLPAKVTTSNKKTMNCTSILDALDAAPAAPEPGEAASEGEEQGLAHGAEEGEEEEEEEDPPAVVLPAKRKQGPYKKGMWYPTYSFLLTVLARYRTCIYDNHIQSVDDGYQWDEETKNTAQGKD